MNKLTIATASLAAAGAVSVLPATADAALTKGHISGRLTLPQFEAEMAERDGGIQPDLCEVECPPKSGTWGALSHAYEDGLQHGYNEVFDVGCEQDFPNAKRGEHEWFCTGKGLYGETIYKYYLWLSPYGYSLEPYSYPK